MANLTRQDSQAPPQSQTQVSNALRRMKAAGDPVLLTIDGGARFTVRDATSYQRLIDLVDRLETIDGIRAGLDDLKAGRMQPLDEAFEQIRRERDQFDRGG